MPLPDHLYRSGHGSYYFQIVVPKQLGRRVSASAAGVPGQRLQRFGFVQTGVVDVGHGDARTDLSRLSRQRPTNAGSRAGDDGDYPAPARFVDIKTRHQAMLLVNGAHLLGTMGRTGRGIGEHANIDHAGVTPVIPVIIDNSTKCRVHSRALFRRGINVQPIINPAVFEHATRLRSFTTIDHTESQVEQTVGAIAEVLAQT